MELTSPYWKNVWQNLRRESKSHPTFVFLLLALLTIPMGYAVNGIAVALLVLATLLTLKKANFASDAALWLPVALFGLMAVSLVWTIDWPSSVKALQKGLPLVLIPLCLLVGPPMTEDSRRNLMYFFSLGMLVFAVFWLVQALVRFAITRDASVLFYHALVTEDVNAIHVSVYVVVAIAGFVTRPRKSLTDKVALILLPAFLVLLSSKNIFVIFILLAVIYGLRHFRKLRQSRRLIFASALVVLIGIAFSGKVIDRFMIEFQTGAKERTINRELSNETGKVYNVSIGQAWSQQRFAQNDYFPGAAFRVYQVRIFGELLAEDPIWLTGYGLNAASGRIREKGLEHNVFSGSAEADGYQNKNFHNQYIQLFAELGIFGLLILIAMLFVNLKNALRSKDFVHISFAILMISLFLTESFLSRQRGIVFFAILYSLFNVRTTAGGIKNRS